ncbi:hypothetical protein GUITHDRAFT_149348 [Guillardia theta CCMP2712]|uniref:RING-type domain-containing protein n=1 Tax=Guillardia theta (strain CCMP2712) TaxID=905079 RepID=L1I663_GUITC|nr:hypothetical protein GUITHDRAFT_149348 [Guillardia theta CCMP2712]EKX31359.1 hypothetical protein GUITHDRAFT_149348 [Guillardia theta CCMP2712]|eukprot:XP_005818339.1 hypothetical protein GUITHDRAFT_149348 [Guillardia theta CCMP2712]
MMMVIVGVLSFCFLSLLCLCVFNHMYRGRRRDLVLRAEDETDDLPAHPGFVVPVSFETRKRAEIILETLRHVPKGRIHLAQASTSLSPKIMNLHVDWEHGDINLLIPNHSGVSEYLDSTVASYISQRSQLSCADMCVLCFDRKRDIQLRPCQHNVFCVQCVSEMLCRWQKREGLLCPICRTPFSSLIYTEPAKAEEAAGTSGDKLERMEGEAETAIDIHAVTAGSDTMTAKDANLVYEMAAAEGRTDWTRRTEQDTMAQVIGQEEGAAAGPEAEEEGEIGRGL